MKNNQPYKINTITEYHQLMDLQKPERPLISVISFQLIQRSTEIRNVPVTLVIGMAMVCFAVKRGPVLRVEEGGRTYKLRLRSVIKKDLVFEFEQYLIEQLGTKLTAETELYANYQK